MLINYSNDQLKVLRKTIHEIVKDLNTRYDLKIGVGFHLNNSEVSLNTGSRVVNFGSITNQPYEDAIMFLSGMRESFKIIKGE